MPEIPTIPEEILETKEWLKVSHSAQGLTSATVTLQRGSLTVKWAEKCFTSTIKAGVQTARFNAEKALKQLEECM